jgi:hypothetical protein
VTLLLKRASASRPSGDVVTFFSTLLDNRRSMLVIEPLSQSDRANSNSCVSDLQAPNPGRAFCSPRHFAGRKEAS